MCTCVCVFCGRRGHPVWVRRGRRRRERELGEKGNRDNRQRQSR